jgi:tungstate transport system ATP-binding protein
VSGGAAPAALALRGVRIRYGGADVLAVDALDVRDGEVLGVIGPNGSGKSTLLRVLGLLERPTSGDVCVRGRPVDARDALAERRQMAVVFQQPLLADMTAAENVALGLRFRGVPGADHAPRVARWLARLGVSGLADRSARTLSGGEAQRIALARALVLEPAVLLLDEPFAALDEPTRASLVADLGAILRADRVTTVIVTHDRGEARALVDRVAVLLAGRLEQVDVTARVFGAPASEDVARFIGVETIVAGVVLDGTAGVARVDVAGRIVEVAAATAAAGERVRVCIRPEDVVLRAPTDHAAASSARNQLAGRVTALTPALAGVRVVVDVGFPLVAAVTRPSIDELGLAPGVPIVAVFKASAVHLLR